MAVQMIDRALANEVRVSAWTFDELYGRDGKFLDALEQGVQYLVNHPDDSWALFIKGRPELDDELNRRAWRDTMPRFALRPAALDRERYARFSKFLAEQGLIPAALPAEAYATELN